MENSFENFVENAKKILKERNLEAKIVFCRAFGSRGNNLHKETSYLNRKSK